MTNLKWCRTCGEVAAPAEFSRLAGQPRCPECNEGEPWALTEENVAEALQDEGEARVGGSIIRPAHVGGYTITGYDYYDTLGEAIEAAVPSK
jgi:hypothetical protein